MTIRERESVRALIKGLEFQVPSGNEYTLMFAVVAQAIIDFTSTGTTRDAVRERLDARRYLQGNMHHAAICGLNPIWIRERIALAGFQLEDNHV